MSDNGSLKMKLNGYLLNNFKSEEICCYPTPCKGRYYHPSSQRAYYPFQAPLSLSILSLLPQMIEAGVGALKIEGRQRSHIYVRKVAQIFRRAIDSYYSDPDNFKIPETWLKELSSLFEGQELTLACYTEK